MANNYAQATMSPVIPLTEEQLEGIAALKRVLVDGEDDENALAGRWCAEFDITEDDEFPDVDEVEPGSYYLYYEEGSLTPGVSMVMQDILRGLDENDVPHLIWEGAYTCSKMRPGEFGGWACVITREDIQWFSTNAWIREVTKRWEVTDR